MELDSEQLEELAASLGVRMCTEPEGIPDGSRMVAIASAIVGESRELGEGVELAIGGLAQALAVSALRRDPQPQGHVPSSSADLRISRALELIHARLAERLSIEELAKVAGMSRYHFSRSFRRATGQSPYAFVLSARLSAAETMLRQRRCSVSEAALSVGFTDLSRFSRKFRERNGCGPSEYRSRYATTLTVT